MDFRDKTIQLSLSKNQQTDVDLQDINSDLLEAIKMAASKELACSLSSIKLSLKSHGKKIAVDSEERLLNLLESENSLRLNVKIENNSEAIGSFEYDSDCKDEDENTSVSDKRSAKLSKQYEKFRKQRSHDLVELRLKVKQIEKLGVENSEELQELKYALRLAERFEKFGCDDSAEFQELKRILRTSQRCLKYGCQNEEEVVELRRSVKSAVKSRTSRKGGKRSKFTGNYADDL
jgi:hypothetical protein